MMKISEEGESIPSLAEIGTSKKQFTAKKVGATRKTLAAVHEETKDNLGHSLKITS
jgi:hypothetical protein